MVASWTNYLIHTMPSWALFSAMRTYGVSRISCIFISIIYTIIASFTDSLYDNLIVFINDATNKTTTVIAVSRSYFWLAVTTMVVVIYIQTGSTIRKCNTVGYQRVSCPLTTSVTFFITVVTHSLICSFLFFPNGPIVHLGPLGRYSPMNSP